MTNGESDFGFFSPRHSASMTHCLLYVSYRQNINESKPKNSTLGAHSDASDAYERRAVYICLFRVVLSLLIEDEKTKFLASNVRCLVLKITQFIGIQSIGVRQSGFDQIVIPVEPTLLIFR